MKDKITNICGLVAATAGSLLTAAQAGLHLSQSLQAVCMGAVAISLAVIGYYTGKKPQ